MCKKCFIIPGSMALGNIRKLAEDTASGVALGVLWQTQVCYLFHGKSGNVDTGIAPDNLYPAEESSIGCVLLSHRAANDIRRRFHTHRNVEGLCQRLAGIREQGYACAPDGNSLAVAVDHPPIAGLAVIHPEVGDYPKPFISPLQAAAQSIVASMAHAKSDNGSPSHD